MRKSGHIYVEIYGHNIHLVWDCKVAEYRRFAKSKGIIDSMAEDSNGRCLSGESATIIWIQKWEEETYDMATLSHECIHAAVMILRDRGIDPMACKEEPLAYLQGWIFQKCMDLILGYEKKQNRLNGSKRRVSKPA
ncbi:MAG: hypothetical protein WCL08_04280 [Verrucomicrobiota bacterium]